MRQFTIADLDLAPCGFLSFNDEGRILGANQTLISLLGCGDRSDLEGKPVESIFTVAGKIFYQTHFFPLLKLQGKAEEIFFSLRGPSGDQVPVICNAERKAENGAWIILCILFPIAQRSRYEQELLEARKKAELEVERNEKLEKARASLAQFAFALDRRLSRARQLNENLVQFSKLVSHDLQEPIRKIAMFAGKIAHDNTSLLKQRSIVELQKLEGFSRQARMLAIQLELFMSLGMITDKAAPVDLVNIVQSAFNEVATLGGNDAALHITSLPVVDSYNGQLETLFFHLLHNAVSYRDHTRPLVVGVSATIIQQNLFRDARSGYRYVDFARIVVTDNGIGFDDEADLFRIRRKKDREAGELSFGLAFCKQITDNHYGSIAIASAKGSGTTVTVLLPLMQETEDH